MQNVVEVACSSPPVVVNATKPTAQAVQVANQDPFDLVLQKASEKVVNNKQSEDASKCSESKSTENKSGSDTTAINRVSESKKEREVVKSAKSEKSEKSEKTDKSEKAEKVEENDKTKDKVTDPTTMVYGYVANTITTEDNTQLVDPQSLAVASEIGDEATESGKMLQVATNAALQFETEVTDASGSVKQTAQAATEQNSEAVTTVQTEGLASAIKDDADTASVETDSKIDFSAALNKGVKVDEKTTTDLKPVISDNNDKTGDTGKVNVSTSTNNQGESVINISRVYQEAASSSVSKENAGKAAEVEITQQTAPPDNPNGTAVTAASAAGIVQTTTQISEPARLAEAPKNEVINQVANQLDQMVKTNRSSVRMQLYPEELGHIDLRIVTTKDGINVTMVTEKASTQQALKSEMDSLRQSIEQAGIQLTNLNINQGQNSNRQQSFEHRQNFSNGSYPGTGSDNSNSSSNEPKKHLTSTVVDYKV